MGRRKGNFGRSVNRGGVSRSVLHSDEEADREPDPDPSSRSYVYDEIDEFHANREKVLLEGGVTRYDHSDDSENEEVYALSGDDDSLDDDDDDDIKNNIAYFEALANKDREDLASDLEDQEDDLPNVKAWGAEKSTFYNTDFVDNDRGYFKEQELRLAEAEEKEAMDMQKRMLEQIDDDDFGLDLLQKAYTPGTEETGTKIVRDVSGMSKEEKIEVIRRESPELLSLLEDFRAKLGEIKNVIKPLVDLVNRGKIPSGPGADYLQMKHELLLNYCTNVCFYVMLKAERADTNNHPIIKRLVGYRKLLKELESVDVILTDQMTTILEYAKTGNDVGKLFENNIPEEKIKQEKLSKTLQEKIEDDYSEADEIDDLDENPTLDPSLTCDEKEALNLYSLMKAGRRDKIDVEENDDMENDDKISNKVLDVEMAVGKRGITTQIAKNKGLTPYRKKDRRNPRLKNRNKYRKATIRRKGQVQQVRRELKKYGGEISGIRISTTRSIKIK